MLKIKGLHKAIEDQVILQDLHLTIAPGSIYGLVGINGAGKTTLIKHIAGVYKADQGTLTWSDEPIYEHELTKQKLGYIPDELFFFSGYSLQDMASFYQKTYDNWDQDYYEQLLASFRLDPNKPISKFSKGMKKQALFILVLATRPSLLLLDEPIDGLDPFVRKKVWKLIIDEVALRQMSVLVSSHNLRELEGVCDHIGILDQGSLILERDLDDMLSEVSKVQVSLSEEALSSALKDLKVLNYEVRGSIQLMIVKATREKILSTLSPYEPAIFDTLPLTLEEIFIYELGGKGYDINEILF